MSDPIHHECGVALLRLKKPLSYYFNTHNTPFFGLEKLYLLMEKQHNRGQDGAGVANIKLNMPPGKRYISRIRSNASSPIQDVFAQIHQKIAPATKEEKKDPERLKAQYAFTGEVFLGHLRYGTFGKNKIENCHPFLRQNNWMTRNLVLSGNFNLTNVQALFEHLTELGQHPKEMSDTVTVLENIGHFLDRENDRLFGTLKKQDCTNVEITQRIADELDVLDILKHSASKWDGGYVMTGMIGHGDAFVLRDPSGIRPAFYYEDDDIFVAASERPAIQTTFNVDLEHIQEVSPGQAVIVKKDGTVVKGMFKDPLPKTSCSFERIYFSRGTDRDIYLERKRLGKTILPQVLEEIESDIDNTVFSFIPNTAETAFLGMVDALQAHLDVQKAKEIPTLDDPKVIETILKRRPRIEKMAVKDAKLRTFISEDSNRDEIVAHVYDVTYGIVQKDNDTLVVMDDSIVRGTTLKKSILRILDRLHPKKIVVVSSAPQIRYPDCYGIDMAKIQDFIAFQAAISMLKEAGQQDLIDQVYKDCKENGKRGENFVKAIYAPFDTNTLNRKIATMLTPPDCGAEISILYQSIEGLHNAIPDHKGDWYFTGDYPTQGGTHMVNQAFVHYYEGNPNRAYG